MARPSKRLLAGLVLFTASLVVVLVYLRGQETPQAPDPLPSGVESSPEIVVPAKVLEIRELGAERVATGVLTGQQVHRYPISLQAGQYLEALVDQDAFAGENIDVVVRVYCQNEKLLEIDSRTLDKGSEAIHLVADDTGTYVVEVDGGKEGRYRFRVLAVRDASQADRDHARAERLFWHARELFGVRDSKLFVQAATEFQEAALLWKALGNKSREADALFRAGEVLEEIDLASALKVRKAASALYEEVGNGKLVVVTLNQIGNTYERLGDLSLMEKSYLRALQVSEETDDAEGRAYSQISLGFVAHRKGEYSKALDLTRQSLSYFKGRPEYWRDECESLSILGLIYSSLGKPGLARDQYLEAEKLLEDNPDDRLKGKILTRLAEIHQDLRQFEQAEAYARQSLRLRVRSGDRRGQGVSLIALGLLQGERGDIDQARRSFQDALAIFRAYSDPRSEAAAHINLGLLALKGRQADEALAAFDSGLALCRKLGFREGEAVALYGMARAERMRGNPGKALSTALDLLDVVESLHVGVRQTDLKAAFLEAKQNGYELLIDLLVHSPSATTPPKNIARAFEINERRIARSLLESLTQSPERAHMDGGALAKLLRKQRDILRQIDEKDRERRQLGDLGESTEAAEAALRELADRLEGVRMEIRFGDPWQTRLDQPAPISLEKARQLLGEDALLLEYHLGQDRSFLWLISRGSAKIFVLPAKSVIEKKVREVNQLLRGSQTEFGAEQATSAAWELSAMILGPVARLLEGKELVIVADGALRTVPFAFLPDPSAGRSSLRQKQEPPYLLRNNRVVNLPSASVLAAIRADAARRTPPEGLLAILGDPWFQPGTYTPLPGTREEARAIGALAPRGERVLVRLGRDATKDLATSGDLSGFRILHFATHGIVDSESPGLSKLVLSQKAENGQWVNGYLLGHDIQTLRLPADLVVLSACDTGRGQELKGEGLVGLTHSFMYAGASRVLVSLWNVNEDSTPLLMERFYQGLWDEGLSPAEALQKAQVWLIDQTEWDSPFYWAGFVLQGEPK